MRLYLDFAAHSEKNKVLALYDKDEKDGPPLVVAPVDQWSEVARDLYAIRDFKERMARFDE
jgi:DNA primase